MADAIQRALLNLCLSALALIGLYFAVYGVIAVLRRFFARIRSLAIALVLGVLAVASTIFGGTKTNGLLQMVFPFIPQVQLTPFTPSSMSSSAASPFVMRSPCASADMPFRAESWNRRGAWNDSFRCAFPDGWVFPFGSGHLDRVEVCSQGRILMRHGTTNVVADIGVPLQIVNPITSFGCGASDRNSYIFAWTNAVVGRATFENVACTETLDASIELFRNGDISVMTNGITKLIPRTLPFPHDGFGQNDEWVNANFTNATEILSAGYPQWVDAQVGDGLTNGLYKFTVTIPEIPPETIQLVVGGYSLAVTNSGEYVFLLEKGVDYEYGTVPFLENVMYSAVDDVPQTRGGLCSLEPDVPTRAWTVDGGYGIEPQTSSSLGCVWWMPLFYGSPDVTHLGPDDGSLTFTANFSDCRVEPTASYSWTASTGLVIDSPNTKVTQIFADSMPSWAQALISVTATIGGHELRSDLNGFSFGMNDSPQIHLSLDVPDAILLNSNEVDVAKIAFAGWSFSSDVPTSGVVTVSCVSGSDKVECQGLLGTWEVSDFYSVDSHIQGVLPSAAVGDVLLRAEFVSGGTVKNVSRLLTVVQAKNIVLPYAPGDGLVVLTNTPIAMQLDCEPAGAGTYLSTTWHTRRLKSDGTYEAWQLASYANEGTIIAFTPVHGGIYQVRVLASVAAGGVDERFYVWEADEPRITGPGRMSSKKAFGVCDEEWQIDLRNCAKSFIGSTNYLEMVEVPAMYGFSASPGADDVYKCNLFVAHRAVQCGLAVPAIHGRFWRNHPPLANEWGDVSFAIQGWECVADPCFPQPGYVSSEPANSGSGHLGIVDFDGKGISAGKDNVNRYFNACTTTTRLRKFVGGEQ